MQISEIIRVPSSYLEERQNLLYTSTIIFIVRTYIDDGEIGKKWIDSLEEYWNHEYSI